MRILPWLFIPLLAVACKKSIEPSGTPPGAAMPAATARPALAPPVAPAPSAAPAPVQGKVLETLDAAGYTYLRLKTAAGDVWAAVPKTPTSVGADVSIVNSMVMRDFESKTLNKKFDRILFGNLGGAALAGNPAGTAPAAQAPAADAAPITVAKAAGANGRTVAEILAQKAALKDQLVEVRGKVVKYNPGVMGKNWLHVRDGSGADGTNDLTVTSLDAAAVGDVVLVKGPVHLDRDFGAGYAYSVIIEDAKLSK